MGVPAHDPRDYEFAKKFDFEIIKVIDDKKTANSLPNVEKGILINSSRSTVYNLRLLEKR